ncbi:alpha/beta fold hydrolase [Sphingosinicella rhizophila]|uniref:Alpha/beta hydrolase n=1 Tax=Sphingosinicella rhizophila TaxID=3050082 RepID=A0ABU3Q9W3_9SPHN|nr:alpha/beta hydrolase [Sphingosinicella sp. GR2756]MDT9600189.1 alpha/beta hydrolase [Sphingosinicella sp. GR2756]
MATAPNGSSKLLRALKWIGTAILTLLAALIAAGIVWEQVERARARNDYPPPGRMIDIGGRNMHLDCRGTGSPTIILEAGLDSNGSLAWDKVHDAIAQDSRTCAYDRAGVMWSDPKPKQDAEAIADDLHALLAAAHIDGPIVLVGHSLGGPYSMTYVRKYGDQVKGLVFVDASHPDQKRRLPPAVLAADKRVQEMYGTQRLLARFGWSGLPRLLMAGEDPGTPSGFSRRTAEVGRAYAAMTLAGTLKEAASLDRSLDQAGKLRDLSDRPLVVLTAQKLPIDQFEAFGMTEQDARDFVAQWRLLTAEEAGWSTRSRHILVPDATHYIQNDRPDLVVKAVAEVVAAVRKDEATASPAAEY